MKQIATSWLKSKVRGTRADCNSGQSEKATLGNEGDAGFPRRVKTSLSSSLATASSGSENAVYVRPFDPSQPRKSDRFPVLTTRRGPSGDLAPKSPEARCYFGRPRRCLASLPDARMQSGDDER
ncbi:hypothetical protein K0M31_010026 [Melipona bicolor]|uniref:Uncharacterized protein n=1 Tax=Melipona bicolor TaxID=60889 RepID=A0AA40FMB6_9HYME|nr:hypothetical protein K0M31_010026 [Melipona bicolor]